MMVISPKKSKSFLLFYMCLLCGCVGVCACAHHGLPEEIKRMTCKSRFSSSILWVSGNELRLTGLVSTFNYRALAMA